MISGENLVDRTINLNIMTNFSIHMLKSFYSLSNSIFCNSVTASANPNSISLLGNYLDFEYTIQVVYLQLRYHI